MIKKIKGVFRKSIPYITSFGVVLGGLLVGAQANAQTFDITPNASTTAAVEPVASLINEMAGQALGFVVAIFQAYWLWALLAGGLFFIIKFLRNTGGHK
jgi:hypothetical protein